MLAEDWGNPQMGVEFDGGTLLLREASEDVPYAEWDDRVEEFRAPAYRYRNVLEWADAWNDEDSPSARQESAHQETIQPSTGTVEDTARAYPELALDPALQIEPREYQQAALDAWRTHERRLLVLAWLDLECRIESEFGIRPSCVLDRNTSRLDGFLLG